jgi:hypothetical protein
MASNIVRRHGGIESNETVAFYTNELWSKVTCDISLWFYAHVTTHFPVMHLFKLWVVLWQGVWDLARELHHIGESALLAAAGSSYDCSPPPSSEWSLVLWDFAFVLGSSQALLCHLFGFGCFLLCQCYGVIFIDRCFLWSKPVFILVIFFFVRVNFLLDVVLVSDALPQVFPLFLKLFVLDPSFLIHSLDCWP